MKIISLIFIITVTFGNVSCHSQNNTNMAEPKHPLLCDPEKGICETPNHQHEYADVEDMVDNGKPITVIYFTDPICSSCWGIEPQLRKLKLEYGDRIAIDYRMGGLLPDWSYNQGGISQPADVAHHWDEVSGYYDMPIDGDVWLEDALHSSYPPSIAFKAAQMQDKEKAIVFLREIREMVFLQKKNITKWVYIETAAKKAGLNIEQLKKDYEGDAKELFEEDLKLSREYGVRGFPTMFFTDSLGQKELVFGSRPYTFYENAVLNLDSTILKNEYKKDWESVFEVYPTLTANEFSTLTQTPRNECEKVLNDLVKENKLEKETIKSGSIWRRK